ncbi:hypothetical protein GUJ93_ZPchr0008g12302 [Zizania palustris]|uniref:Uncharacterized protein n=1 Tax=Zizania palustris TaxID=103762 RepID=A0A8J5RNF9_ZIZPA|nr:hypothetical protein GUJ93_ZPchr0008g12302 [Zizania palustris]
MHDPNPILVIDIADQGTINPAIVASKAPVGSSVLTTTSTDLVVFVGASGSTLVALTTVVKRSATLTEGGLSTYVFALTKPTTIAPSGADRAPTVKPRAATEDPPAADHQEEVLEEIGHPAKVHLEMPPLAAKV